MDHIFLNSAMAVLKKQPAKVSLLLLFSLLPIPAAADLLSLAQTDTRLIAEGRVSGQNNPGTVLLETGVALHPALIAPQDLAPLLPDLRGRTVRAYGTSPPDRHGRLPVQIILSAAPERWWQAETVGAGLARVWTNDPPDAALTALLAQEDEARRHNRGHWSRPDWQPVCADTPDALHTGAFALIQGTIRRASLRQGTLWLDFGADWRTDTSATLPAPVLKALPKDRRQPAFWTGKTVEIRGWVQGGPRLDLTAAGQIRLLPAEMPPCRGQPLKN